MKWITGNLLHLADEGKFDVIVHGCNCYHAMGGGIARSIAIAYPEAKAADLQTRYGSREKLGNFSHAVIKRRVGQPFHIVNGYTQFGISGYKDVFEYEAFETLLNRLSGFLYQLHEDKGSTLRIGFPKIGCGLARGDESRIIPMIEKFARDVSPWGEVSLVSLP